MGSTKRSLADIRGDGKPYVLYAAFGAGSDSSVALRSSTDW